MDVIVEKITCYMISLPKKTFVEVILLVNYNAMHFIVSCKSELIRVLNSDIVTFESIDSRDRNKIVYISLGQQILNSLLITIQIALRQRIVNMATASMLTATCVKNI